MAQKVYVCSHNTLHDYASKIKFDFLSEAKVYFENVVKLGMSHMYYTIVDSSDKVIRDSRVEENIKNTKKAENNLRDKEFSVSLTPAFRQSYNRFAVAAGLSQTYSFAFEHIAEYYYRIFVGEI